MVFAAVNADAEVLAELMQRVRPVIGHSVEQFKEMGRVDKGAAAAKDLTTSLDAVLHMADRHKLVVIHTGTDQYAGQTGIPHALQVVACGIHIHAPGGIGFEILDRDAVFVGRWFGPLRRGGVGHDYFVAAALPVERRNVKAGDEASSEHGYLFHKKTVLRFYGVKVLRRIVTRRQITNCRKT